MPGSASPGLTAGTKSSFCYWTIVDTYVVEGSKNDVSEVQVAHRPGYSGGGGGGGDLLLPGGMLLAGLLNGRQGRQ